MGIDVKFVRVDQRKLKQLLDGEIECDSLEPSIRSLPRDQNGQVEAIARLAYKYANGSEWSNVAEEATKMKVSESDLKQAVRKYGLHFCLDTSREWNELHKLLTGEYALDRVKLRKESGDIFSTAIIAGRTVDGDSPSFGDFGECYLTHEQVQEIAAKLKPLTYENLSTKNKVETGVGEENMRELFDSFKAFFVDAASEKEAVIRQSG